VSVSARPSLSDPAAPGWDLASESANASRVASAASASGSCYAARSFFATVLATDFGSFASTLRISWS
jgi:hypothetical protein